MHHYTFNNKAAIQIGAHTYDVTWVMMNNRAFRESLRKALDKGIFLFFYLSEIQQRSRLAVFVEAGLHLLAKNPMREDVEGSICF